MEANEMVHNFEVDILIQPTSSKCATRRLEANTTQWICHENNALQTNIRRAVFQQLHGIRWRKYKRDFDAII